MEITGLTVVYNTFDLIKTAYESFRKFYPSVPLLIMNNSDPEDRCTRYLKRLERTDSKVEVCHYNENVGHGQAAREGIEMIKTKYVYYFDSDTIMYQGGVLEKMLKIMDDETYGISRIIYIDRNGKNIRNDFKGERIKYLYFVVGLLNRNMYFRFHHWTRFGLPIFKAMIEINDAGIADKALKNFPVWEYVRHIGGGTRSRFGDCEDIVKGFRGVKADMNSELD